MKKSLALKTYAISYAEFLDLVDDTPSRVFFTYFHVCSLILGQVQKRSRVSRRDRNMNPQGQSTLQGLEIGEITYENTQKLMIWCHLPGRGDEFIRPSYFSNFCPPFLHFKHIQCVFLCELFYLLIKPTYNNLKHMITPPFFGYCYDILYFRLKLSIIKQQITIKLFFCSRLF